MKTFSNSLIAELDRQLEFIHDETDNPQIYSENAIHILISILEKLKSFLITYKFANKVEEINFFREIKPRFASKLIYYNEIFNIESNRPVGSEKTIRKYYNAELVKLKFFTDENLEFYRYYRKGSRYLDNKYFMRGQQDVRLTLDSFYFQADKRFSTSHDYKVARIMANDLLQVYLKEQIKSISKIPDMEKISQDFKNPVRWTGSKVALIELIYALHCEKVINDGKADLKEIVSHFQTVLNIDLGQFNRTFLEIRERKSDRAKFLKTLKTSLIKKMNEADEK